MKKFLKFSLILLLLFTFQYNSQAQSTSFRIKVKSGLQHTPPYLVKYFNSKDWETFYLDIQQFDYDPKFEYNIRVKKHRINQRSTYILDKIIRKSSSENTDTLTWDVNETYVNASKLGKMKCLQIKSNGSTKWEYITTPIQGFDYREGYRYRIKVQQTKQQDTDTLQYQLIEIIAKEKATELPSVASFLARFKWNLLQLNGKDVSTSRASIGFDAKNGTVAGFTGCNTFWGNFNIKDNLIRFSHLASNMRSCNDIHIENAFFDILEQKNIQFDIAEQTLNLYVGNKLVMIFGLERQ